jgi:hypothetical protein
MADRVLDGPLRTVSLAIPGLKVFVTSSPGDDAVQAVRQARADAVVVWSRPQEHRDLDGVVLGSVLFGIVLPLGHALADRAEIPVAALGSESAVMFPWSPFAGIWQRTVDHLLPAGAQPGQVVVEPDLINSPEAMLRAVAAGSGVAPGILGVVEHMNVGGIVVLPLDPPLLLDLEVVWRRPARPTVRRLVDFLVEAVEEAVGSQIATSRLEAKAVRRARAVDGRGEAVVLTAPPRGSSGHGRSDRGRYSQPGGRRRGWPSADLPMCARARVSVRTPGMSPATPEGVGLGRTTMRVEDFSGDDAAVYRAVAEAEVRVGAPHLQDIARGAGLDLDGARAAVHRLLHTEPKILHEVPGSGPTDLGPTYELAPRT